MTTAEEEIGALAGADTEAVVVPAPVATDTDDWSVLTRDDPRLYLNREFAELQFQFRVLFEAIDSQPAARALPVPRAADAQRG